MSETGETTGSEITPISLSGEIAALDPAARTISLKDGPTVALPEGFSFDGLEAGKPFDPFKPAEAAPHEAWAADTLKLPDGIELNEDLMGEFVSFANENKLPANVAQGLVDLQAKAMNAVSEQTNRLWGEMQEKWANEAKADPVIGGDKLDPALANISKLIDAFSMGQDGKPDPKEAEALREVIDLAGVGNNPRVIRFLSNIAQKLVTEGGPIQPGSPGSSEVTAAQILYPNQGKG